MIERIYIEIGNICNLKCSFCPSSTDFSGDGALPRRQMTTQEFKVVCDKIKGHTKYAYLHVLGEPLLHCELGSFIDMLSDADIAACITTNGTLLEKRGDIILSRDNIHKVSISLHAHEANDTGIDLEDYIKGCADFAKKAAKKGVFTVFRLWNLDSASGLGQNSDNERIHELLHEHFSEEWSERRHGYRLCSYVFLEYDGIFTWPKDSKADDRAIGFCRAIKDQLAILVDGTVVPCCLDSGGNIPLGNIYDETIDEILKKPRTVNMYNGFRNRCMVEDMCKKCTYADRFSKQ